MKTNWPVKKLGGVLELCDSGTWGKENLFGMPLLRSSNMQKGQLILADLKFIEVPENKRDYYTLKEGDILVTKSSGSVDHIGKSLYITNQMDRKYGFSNFTQRLRVNRDLAIPKWIYYKISNPATRDFLLGASQTTTGLRNLKITTLKELEIPLPPLETQKKIVSKIEKLFAKIDEAQKLREEAKKATLCFFQTTLHKFFEENGKKFDSKELGQIAKLVRGPFGGSLRKDIFTTTGYAVYEQGNVIKNRLNQFRYFITAEKFHEMKRFAIGSGDILMSCSGTIGKFLTIPEKYEKGIINQALLKISPLKIITTDYLQYILSDYISQNIARNTKGSAIKNIVAVSLLKKIKIPIPPIAEQKKIVARLDTLMEKVRELQRLQSETAADLTNLKQSILARAFKGEL